VSACDNVCLCLCVCVCMCVCVCVCVCVHRITIESRKGRESLRYRHVCMYECIHICMYMCMNVSMYARVFVCVCVCVCEYYSQEKWLDKDTRSVKIRFIFYNGNIGSQA
jgi:hypothetical protein